MAAATFYMVREFQGNKIIMGCSYEGKMFQLDYCGIVRDELRGRLCGLITSGGTGATGLD